MGPHAIPLGFPFYYPPDGVTHHILSLTNGSQLNADVPVVEGLRHAEKGKRGKQVVKGDLLIGISIKERHRLMALFNARARYVRRIFVTATKM